MPYVYILYSPSTNKHYIGFTSETVAQRLEKHNSDYYKNKFTAIGKPWELFAVSGIHMSISILFSFLLFCNFKHGYYSLP